MFSFFPIVFVIYYFLFETFNLLLWCLGDVQVKVITTLWAQFSLVTHLYVVLKGRTRPVRLCGKHCYLRSRFVGPI